MVRVGISGWRYGPWRGVFYPPGLRHDEELAYASRLLPTIEINGSFYSLQKPALYRTWYAESPEGFVFALKGSRYITHMLKLGGVEAALANLFASGPLELRDKLGPVLWQLPPMLGYDADRLARFFDLLPRDSEAAAALAHHHDARIKGEAALVADARRPLRHALEVRHPSFVRPDFLRLLERHQIALVIADSAGRFPSLEAVTTDFAYVRLHGDEELYRSEYRAEVLDGWAEKIARWSRQGDVYCYFDNDAKVHAPFDAARLLARLGLPYGPPLAERETTAGAW